MRHVPHLYLPGDWPDTEVPLSDPHLRHLTRVLRRPSGSPTTYTDGSGLLGSGVFTGTSIERGEERIVERTRLIRAVVAPPSDRDRQRFVVEKLAELGVARLTWLDSRHGQGRAPRLERARSWAQAALEQSRGAWHMEIDATAATLSDLDRPVLVCDAGGPSEIPSGDVAFAVGPEGGWADGEIPADCARLDLGDRVLRVETAAIATAVLLLRTD